MPSQTALITGASTGIGHEFSKVFAENGFDLILVARNAERLADVAAELKKTYKVQVRTIAKDLADPAAPKALYEEVRKIGTPIDVLVNNAGVGQYGPFVDAEEKEVAQLLQLNIFSLTLLTRLVAKDMVGRGKGYILNVASTAAFQPGPLMAIYFASKAFVLHFSEALAEELRGAGILVTALCPGATESNFFKSAKMESSKLTRQNVMDAATVARRGYRALMNGTPVVIPGVINKLTAFSVRMAPRSWVTKISRKMMESV